MQSIIRQPTTAELLERIAQLERRLAEVERTRHAFDVGAAGVTISERRRYEFVAALAQPRLLVNFTAHNRTTGATITCSDYSAAQLERAAFKFARLFEPKRRHWRGDKQLYGLMLKLFEQHGAIVRDHGRLWAWADGAWPEQRRIIAGAIVSHLSGKTHTSKSPRTANV